MTSLISLPHLKRKDLGCKVSIPASLRARAGLQIRQAVRAGRIGKDELSVALSKGDTGVAELMYRHHVLRGDIKLPSIPSSVTMSDASVNILVSWARHLRDANRIENQSLKNIPQESALTQLLVTCVSASTPNFQNEIAKLPCEPSDKAHRHIYYRVSTSFAEEVYGNSNYRHSQENEPLSVFIEPVVIPLVYLPETHTEDDTLALLSAVDAISNASEMAMMISPRHIHEIVNSWFIELLTDAAISAKKRMDGTPIFTVGHCEAIAEEIGLVFEDDPEGMCRSLEAHYAFLNKTQSMKIWQPNSKNLKKWLQSNHGTDLHSLVTRLLGIASRLGKISIKAFDVEYEHSGEYVGLMAASPTPPELTLFESLENYGESEMPQLKISMESGRQNPSAFWQMHESVLMAVTLITEAANAITTYERNHLSR